MNYFGKKYPELDELVLVRIEEVRDYSVIVELIGYDNIQGMIILSEISRKKIHSLKKLMRIGKEEVMQILRLSNGSIDLTKKNISEEETKSTLEFYSKCKKLFQILKYLSERLELPIESLLKPLMWDLFQEDWTVHPIDILFSKILKDELPLPFEQEQIEKIKQEFQLRISPSKQKLEAVIDVTCFNEYGIDAIKNSLKKGKIDNIEIRSISMPSFRLTLDTFDRDDAIEKLKESISLIGLEIKSYGGQMELKSFP